MDLANDHGYGLSSSIYTTNALNAFRFRERITAGMVSVNNSTSGAEAHLPFGGNGKSGNGSRQSGIWVLDQFTRWQSLNWDYAGKLQKAQMDIDEIEGRQGVPAMSGLFGKAARFAKSKQGKEALEKVQKYAKSDQGKEQIEALKDKVDDLRGKDEKPEAKPAPAPAVDATKEPKPDPASPTPPPAA